MKTVVILPDGAADEPLQELDGRTPLSAASTPNLDRIAAMGRVGFVKTVPDELLPGSDVATLSLLGYDPLAYYPGRAPLEAAANGIAIGQNELVFRCNLVTISDGRMQDFSAGHISTDESQQLIEALNAGLSHRGVHFHAGISYRHLMIMPHASWIDVQCTPPHDIPGQLVEQFLPRGEGAERVQAIMSEAERVLSVHDVNVVRRDLGENPATGIWLWGQGKAAKLHSFSHKFGRQAAVIAAVDLIRGIGTAAGLEIIDVPGATGYLDTNYAGKGQAAVDAVDRLDIVIVHIEAPDEAGHNGDLKGKIAAIEAIDTHIVGPVMDRLNQESEWRMLVAPDHPTPVERRIHTRTPPPFCLAGGGITPDGSLELSEACAAFGGWLIDPGHELMEFVLRR